MSWQLYRSWKGPLAGPHRRCGRSGEERNLSPCSEFELPAMTVLTELSQVSRPWLYWQNYSRFHGYDCTDRIIPDSTPWLYWQKYSRFHAMAVLTEVSQVPWPWLYWQKYPRFHGHDCTDRSIPGSTPWLYWQKYPRFHAMTVLTEVSQILRHDYWQKYPRSYGRSVVLKVVQLLPMSIPLCGLHTRAVCLSVAPSRNASCLHACIINGGSLCEWSLMSIWSILSKLWIGAFEGIVYINHVWIETDRQRCAQGLWVRRLDLPVRHLDCCIMFFRTYWRMLCLLVYFIKRAIWSRIWFIYFLFCSMNFDMDMSYARVVRTASLTSYPVRCKILHQRTASLS
jgi:hypothetical protein